MADLKESLRDISVKEDLVKYLRVGKSPGALGNQLLGFFKLLNMHCDELTWNRFLGKAKGKGPRDYKFFQYCEAIALLTNQRQPYFQYCSRDQAAAIYRLTDGSMVTTCGKFWMDNKEVVNDFLKELHLSHAEGFDFGWELYPEEEIIAELQVKYPEEYPKENPRISDSSDSLGACSDDVGESNVNDSVAELEVNAGDVEQPIPDDAESDSIDDKPLTCPEGNITAELQGKYPKGDPRTSESSDSLDACSDDIGESSVNVPVAEPEVNAGDVEQPLSDETESELVDDEPLIVPKKVRDSDSGQVQSRLTLRSSLKVIVVIVLCIAGASAVYITDQNGKRTAAVEKINQLSPEAYETVKLDPESKWVIFALRELATNIDVNGTEETKRQLAQIEEYLYWVRALEEDGTYQAKALAKLPNGEVCVFPEILRLRGQLYLKTEDLENGMAALAEFEAAMKLPVDERLELNLLVERAAALDFAGKHAVAIKEIDEAIPEIRKLSNNSVLLRKAMFFQARAYVARAQKGDYGKAIAGLKHVLEGADESELLVFTTPLSLTEVANELYALARTQNEVAEVDNMDDVLALREAIKSRVHQFGLAGKESQNRNRIQAFFEAVNENLTDEQNFKWSFSLEQYRLAKAIFESPALAKLISDKEKAKFVTLDLSIAAKLSKPGPEALHNKLVGYRKLIASTPMSVVEKSVFSLMALETAFAIYSLKLEAEDHVGFDFRKFANDMSDHLSQIEALPLKYRQRIKDFSTHVNSMVDDTSTDHVGFRPTVNFKAKFDNHNFQFEETILDREAKAAP
jgi:tetratricopeptide (TPR) repeat protein